jgi:hypothetical protein
MFHRTRPEVFLLASALAGCGALFGIDNPERAEPAVGGASGNGGTSKGGASGDGASGGGTAGNATPEGGAGMAGDGGEVATGGSGGGATGGGGGGGTAGSSDAGGGGDGDEFPNEGEPCATPGALACLGPAQKKRLICLGGMWTETDACKDDDLNIERNCDRRSGACAVVPQECVRADPFDYSACEGSLMRSCGPDLVNIVVEECYFGCHPNDKTCNDESGGALIVDRVPPTQGDFVFWPTPVPVCFEDEVIDEVDDTDRAVIRDEVESTWGRYASIAFSGWGLCSIPPTDVAEVRISLEPACESELARIPRYGYPGPRAKLDLEICKRYVDDNGYVEVDDALLRYVARHLFGHVLGRAHDSVGDFMGGIIELSWIPDLVFGERTIDVFQQTYGGKPSGSLVNAGGRCVGSPDGDAVDMRVCDGSTETRWQALKGQLVAEDGTKCLRASGSGSASLWPCEPTAEDFVWETNDVQWRGYGGRCVTKSTASIYWSLVLEPCRALGDADQTWSFDFYEDRRVRIRRADNECVHIPEADGEAPQWPELAPCDASDGARDGLEITRSGQLALSGYCIESDASSNYAVRLSPCRAIPAQSYYLSGPLGHDDGVLTLSSDGRLNAAPMSGAPSQAQIFDYHF